MSDKDIKEIKIDITKEREEEHKAELEKQKAEFAKKEAELKADLKKKEDEAKAEADKIKADFAKKEAELKADEAVTKAINEDKMVPSASATAKSIYLNDETEDKAEFTAFVKECPKSPVEEEEKKKKELKTEGVDIIDYATFSQMDFNDFEAKFDKGEIGLDLSDPKFRGVKGDRIKAIGDISRAQFALPSLDDQTLMVQNTGSFIVPALWEQKMIEINKANYLWSQFTVKGISSMEGDTIHWAVNGTLSTPTARGTLDEGTAIDKGTITLNEITASPEEYGNSVTWSRKNNLLSRRVTDLKNNVMFKALSRNQVQVKDDEAYRVAKIKTGATTGTTKIIYGGTYSYNFGTGADVVGTAYSGTVGNDDFLMSGSTLRTARMYLENADTPTLANGFYACIMNPTQSEAIFDDDQVTGDVQYANPADLLTGEVGKWRGVQMFKSTRITGTTIAFGTSGTVTGYEAIMLGDEAIGEGWVIENEINFYDDAHNDSKRTKKVDWYALGAYKKLKPENVVILLTTGKQ